MKKRTLNTLQFGQLLGATLDTYERARDKLPQYGRELVKQICGPAGWMSLRECSRRSKLSPTYLSEVLNGKATISAGAYLVLCRVLETQGKVDIYGNPL